LELMPQLPYSHMYYCCMARFGQKMNLDPQVLIKDSETVVVLSSLQTTIVSLRGKRTAPKSLTICRTSGSSLRGRDQGSHRDEGSAGSVIVVGSTTSPDCPSRMTMLSPNPLLRYYDAANILKSHGNLQACPFLIPSRRCGD